MTNTHSAGLRRIGLSGVAALVLATGTLASVAPASAFGPRERFVHGGGGGFRHHRGLGVGAAVGLGVLGAAAAGAAASQYYNGYPVYPEGGHTGYGYDYYPSHGGYYGPY
jgi:hypothetical protein